MAFAEWSIGAKNSSIIWFVCRRPTSSTRRAWSRKVADLSDKIMRPDNAREAMSATKEPQYHDIVEQERDRGLESFGLMTSYAWNDDPKRLTFTLSRYKFVSKLMSGRKHILEIGCADAFGTRIVRQEVQKLTATDFDPVFIEDVKKRMNPQWEFDAFVHDMLSGPVPGSYDGAYALDVLEHIEPAKEDIFLTNMVKSLSAHGIAVLGMPSLESQIY